MSLTPTPEEAKWLRRLARVMRDIPDTVWLFGASGTLTALRTGPNGEAMTVPNGTNIDQDYVLDSPPLGFCDGGDW